MKKNGFSKILIGVLLIIAVLSCVGCGGSANQNENKEEDNSTYVGIWKTLDDNGDTIELKDDGSVVNPVEKVVFSYTWNADNNYVIIDNKKYTYTTLFEKEALKCEDEENKYYVREDGYKEIYDEAHVVVDLSEDNFFDYFDIDINKSRVGGTGATISYDGTIKLKQISDNMYVSKTTKNFSVEYNGFAYGNSQINAGDDTKCYYDSQYQNNTIVMPFYLISYGEIADIKSAINDFKITDNAKIIYVKNEYAEFFK